MKDALASVLGSDVRKLVSVAGGDINDAYAATLANGSRVFVKTRAEVPSGMYEREAEGLRWLAEAGALRVPQVVHADPRFLVLELIDKRGRAGDFEERLGRGLAALHRFGAPKFGLATDNYVGSLPQANDTRDTWAVFYREQRLLPLLRRACLPKPLAREFDALLDRLPSLVGPEEPPARLHGDLWSGNVMSDEQGAPVLVDPAVYGGHREIDLAMLRLFGAPSLRFFAAYDELYPRAPGHDERTLLYQLYPLLVHVCLFGGSYVAQLAHAVRAYL